VESVAPGNYTERVFFSDHHCDGPRDQAATGSAAITLKGALADHGICCS